MKKKIFSFLLVLLLYIPFSLGAQSDEIIDIMLLEEQATFGKTVYMCLAASGKISDAASVQNAMEVLTNLDWGITIKEDKDYIEIGEVAYLLMRSFELPGGMMYSIFPGPRYAFRELVFMGLLKEKGGPYRRPTGSEVLKLISDLLDLKGEES